jgi:hypothetical protein
MQGEVKGTRAPNDAMYGHVLYILKFSVSQTDAPGWKVS